MLQKHSWFKGFVLVKTDKKTAFKHCVQIAVLCANSNFFFFVMHPSLLINLKGGFNELCLNLLAVLV